MEVKEFIGLDVGKARTGMSRGSDAARLAHPLKTIASGEVIDELKKLETELSGIVVGLPRSLNGEDTSQTHWVREWVKLAKEKINLPFYWQDEALTSKLAEARQLEGGQIKDIDALAAQIILQDFLDSPEAARVVA